MITDEGRGDDGSEYEPFWAADASLGMPLSLHTATRQQGRNRGAADKTLRDALPALHDGLHVPRASATARLSIPA